jgi:hypothetical protein
MVPAMMAWVITYAPHEPATQQNKTKQNKTKQNKIKQNKTKHCSLSIVHSMS